MAPELISLPAIGTEPAAMLFLLTVGDNPERLGSEASFASLLCGVSPVEASSGKVVRDRLNLMQVSARPEQRALHLICVVRMRVDERTRRYELRVVAPRASLLKQEIMRSALNVTQPERSTVYWFRPPHLR